MNIFWLDEDKKRSAKSLADKHIVKMPVEYSQMLHTALRLNGFCEEFPEEEGKLYRKTHKNHPATQWVAESLENWLQLYELLLETGKEYENRYGNGEHKSVRVTKELDLERVREVMPSEGETEKPLCMPDEYKGDCPVRSYRRYYVGEKAELGFEKSERPEWLESALVKAS